MEISRAGKVNHRELEVCGSQRENYLLDRQRLAKIRDGLRKRNIEKERDRQREGVGAEREGEIERERKRESDRQRERVIDTN